MLGLRRLISLFLATSLLNTMEKEHHTDEQSQDHTDLDMPKSSSLRIAIHSILCLEIYIETRVFLLPVHPVVVRVVSVRY